MRRGWETRGKPRLKLTVRRVDPSQGSVPLSVIVSEQNDPRAWSNQCRSPRSTMAAYCISYTPSLLPEVKHALSVSSSRTMRSFVVECPRIGHGQGPLGTTEVERNAHKCGKENQSHSHEGHLCHSDHKPFKSTPPSCGSSVHLRVEDVCWSSPQGRTADASAAVWEKFVPRCFPPSAPPSPRSLNQHVGLPLAVASPETWLGNRSTHDRRRSASPPPERRSSMRQSGHKSKFEAAG